MAFFEKALGYRDSTEQPWLDDVVPFRETAGKRVLEIGFGPGYDALKFMQAGAIYSGIDITPENVERTKRHLGFFGFKPDVQQGDAENLPFPDASFDVVYSNGVLHHVPDIDRAFQEARRVLTPQGEFRILLYNRNSVFYAGLIALHIMSGDFLRETLTDRRSRIEATSAEAKPIVNVYSRREVTKILKNNGFSVRSIIVRKCTPDDLPLPSYLCNQIPQSIYDTLSRIAGWYLIVRAIPTET